MKIKHEFELKEFKNFCLHEEVGKIETEHGNFEISKNVSGLTFLIRCPDSRMFSIDISELLPLCVEKITKQSGEQNDG